MANNRRRADMRIGLHLMLLRWRRCSPFLDPPAQPTTVPREAGNPFDAAFDLERGFQGRFQSKEAFEEYQRECLAQRNGQDKAQVDLADRDVWRKKLFGAIRDFSEVENQARRKGQSTRVQGIAQASASPQSTQPEAAPVFIENTHVRRARALEDDEVEMISYELLDIVEKAHQGQVNIGNWAEGGQWTFQQYPSFASRVEALLHALKINKAVPVSFADPDYIMRWACAPAKEVVNSEENLHAAAVKREQLASAKRRTEEPE
ncbi:hypothetical protein SMACR_09441 [Sordaria macrospora]|uniref:WGS project CABT00000000 data, contig 2.89 n=2 Tax=Sordaria macrospora TaxID=5147 RepID=F7WBY8_SORMK|nr:uncharacterized protein SMAC_09441 [Sordaria macrospora k-hell]KAA8628005.1 hypothetical protein SMACR_09441 [Sordaria macrospora]WPJ62629.1 hypothetical protein SMAC4_09441 [Sordaria macrospora]CCC05511.1 unnamed protein product [Sordaria macrospora k-hell]